MFEIKKAAVYTRVSTQEQASEGYSIEEQERMCRAAIESKGWVYVGTHSDPGISGRTMERPGLLEMIERIKRKEIEAVVIYKLDRLSRKQKDTMAIIEDVFMKNDVYLLSLNETLDTSTPWGRAMIGILSSFNQMESENIQMRTADGRKAKAATGAFSGGKPPLGYVIKDGSLILESKGAEAVRRVFELRSEGYTYQNIADRLNEEGYSTKSGKPFLFSTIQVILNNRKTYEGYYRYGKGGEWVQGQHEPILEEGEFLHE